VADWGLPWPTVAGEDGDAEDVAKKEGAAKNGNDGLLFSDSDRDDDDDDEIGNGEDNNCFVGGTTKAAVALAHNGWMMILAIAIIAATRLV